jgi:hypothetical protein
MGIETVCIEGHNVLHFDSKAIFLLLLSTVGVWQAKSKCYKNSELRNWILLKSKKSFIMLFVRIFISHRRQQKSDLNHSVEILIFYHFSELFLLSEAKCHVLDARFSISNVCKFTFCCSSVARANNVIENDPRLD